MDFAEEQRNEVEALESIYLDDMEGSYKKSLNISDLLSAVAASQQFSFNILYTYLHDFGDLV